MRPSRTTRGKSGNHRPMGTKARIQSRLATPIEQGHGGKSSTKPYRRSLHFGPPINNCRTELNPPLISMVLSGIRPRTNIDRRPPAGGQGVNRLGISFRCTPGDALESKPQGTANQHHKRVSRRTLLPAAPRHRSVREELTSYAPPLDQTSTCQSTHLRAPFRHTMSIPAQCPAHRQQRCLFS